MLTVRHTAPWQRGNNTHKRRCPLGTVLDKMADTVFFDVLEPNFGKRVQLKLPYSSTYHDIVNEIIRVTGLPEGVFVSCQNGRAIDKSLSLHCILSLDAPIRCHFVRLPGAGKQDNDEEKELLLAIDESRRSANMKPCYTCHEWTSSPISSRAQKDCPHSACCLKCLLAMESDWVTLKNEMIELDESFEVLSSAAPNSSNAIDAQTHTAARGDFHGILLSCEVWHEEKIANDGNCGFNAAAYLLRHHLPFI